MCAVIFCLLSCFKSPQLFDDSYLEFLRTPFSERLLLLRRLFYARGGWDEPTCGTEPPGLACVSTLLGQHGRPGGTLAANNQCRNRS